MISLPPKHSPFLVYEPYGFSYTGSALRWKAVKQALHSLGANRIADADVSGNRLGILFSVPEVDVAAFNAILKEAFPHFSSASDQASLNSLLHLSFYEKPTFVAREF